VSISSKIITIIPLITLMYIGLYIYDQAYSYGSDVIFTNTSSQDPIHTVSSYSSNPCNLYATITILSVYYNGSIRNNPDGTYYAGDAFKYVIEHGYKEVMGEDESCSDYYYWLDVKDASIIGSKTNGVLEIDSTAQGVYRFVFNQSIKHTVCFMYENRICHSNTYINKTIYAYKVIEPNIDAKLSKVYLYDDDGFITVNKDGTYYINDPIAIAHSIYYRFKDDRIGTLKAIVNKEHDLLHDYEYTCSKITCNHTLINNNYRTIDHLHFGYNDGINVYIARDNSMLGKHKIIYKITLINIDKVIGYTYASIDAEVVRYEPVYHVYAYLVLNSEGEWAYAKDVALALHYHGSKDDDGLIHELRRSKINANEYNTIAYMFNLTDGKEIDKGSLMLKYAIADHYNKESNTLLFDKEGYGKLVFSYNIQDEALKHKYSSIALNIRLYSKHFGGYDNLMLSNVVYMYPAVKFSNILEVQVYDSHGNIKDIPVSLSLIPMYNHDYYLHNYLRSKVIHDSKHEKFAEMVMDDMYSKDNIGYGLGYVKMKVNYTSHYIPNYMIHDYGSLLDIPLHIALDAPTPYMINVKVGDLTKVYYEPTYSFYRDYKIIVNTDDDNYRLVKARLTDRLDLMIDKRFGKITNIYVNDSYYKPELYCRDMPEHYMCNIYDIDSRLNAVDVILYNDWYGKASLTVIKDSDATKEYDGRRINNNNLQATIIISSLALTIFIAYRLIRGMR
jgi:hypothetical protein